MNNLLPVWYVSQIGSGANSHANDCGGASSLMLLGTYNLAQNITVDKFYDSIVPSGDRPLSAGDMQIAMSRYGIKTEWRVDMTMEQMFGYLRNEKPILALVHYGTLVDAGVTQRKGFRSGHFLVVTGIDLENVYVDDPYRDDGLMNIAVPHAVFEKCWRDCVLDGNPVGGCVIPKLSIQDLNIPVPPNTDEYYIVSMYNGRPVNAINVRLEADGNSTLVRTIWRTNEPVVRAIASSITNGYIRLADLSGYVWFEFLKKK